MAVAMSPPLACFCCSIVPTSGSPRARSSQTGRWRAASESTRGVWIASRSRLGSALAGLAGAVMAPLMSVDPQMGVGFLIPAFLSILVGGSGTLLGALLGTTLIAGASTVVSSVWSQIAAQIVVFGLAIVIIRLFPQGLVGAAALIKCLRRMRVALSASVWLAMAAAPMVLSEWRLLQLSQFITYGIFALSLAFLWGQAGLLCFGQAIFFGIGAYAMSLSTKGMVPIWVMARLPGCWRNVCCPAWLRWLQVYCCFAAEDLSGAYFAIVTLAAAAIVERLASHWDYLGGFNGLLDVPPLQLSFGATRYELIDAMPVYFALLLAAALVYLILLALERSPFGNTLRAVRDNEARTPYLGIDVGWCKTWSLTISGAVAGFAGALVRDPVRICFAGVDRCAAVDRSVDLDGIGRQTSAVGGISGCHRRTLGGKRFVRGVGRILVIGSGRAVRGFGGDFSARCARPRAFVAVAGTLPAPKAAGS